LQWYRQLNHAEALQQSQSGDRGVKVQAGRESSAKRQAESFDRIHGGSLAPSVMSGRAIPKPAALERGGSLGLFQRPSLPRLVRFGDDFSSSRRLFAGAT
jgi:hypothetical protein